MDNLTFNIELFEEIVARDFYNLRDLPPNEFDVIIDLGGNIGIFTQYAKTLFPRAKAIAVEADYRVMGRLEKRLSDVPNTEVVLLPIGTGGVVYQHNRDHLNQGATIFGTNVAGEQGCPELESVTLAQVVGDLSLENALIKIDIEGSERFLFNDPDTVEIISKAKRIVAETHWGPTFTKAGSGWESYDACMRDVEAAFGEIFRMQNINRHPRKDPTEEDGSGVLVLTREGAQTGTWIDNCARCNHGHFVNFKPFTRPNPHYSAFGFCPRTGEPILQKVVPD